MVDLGPLGRRGAICRDRLRFKDLAVGESVTASVVETEMDNGYSLLQSSQGCQRSWLGRDTAYHRRQRNYRGIAL